MFSTINMCLYCSVGSPGGASGKDPTCRCGDVRDRVQPVGGEDPLEEGLAAHSRILAWRIPWTEEPSRLQFMGSQSRT